MRAMQYVDPRMRDQIARAREELDQLVRTVLPRRVRRPGLLADLLDLREAGDLTQEELLGLITFLCTVGQAPTAFALSMTALCLLRHADELARLRAQPDLLRGVLDEAVRFDSPTRLIRRFATSGLGSTASRSRPGSRFRSWCRPSIAIRRCSRSPIDSTSVVARSSTSASGWGSHLCMEPHLTRIIAEEVIDLLLEEFPVLALGERLEMATGLFFLGPSVMDLIGRRGAQVRQQGRPVPVAKAGRNDTCPCGSGKKYKRCHGAAA